MNLDIQQQNEQIEKKQLKRLEDILPPEYREKFKNTYNKQIEENNWNLILWIELYYDLNEENVDVIKELIDMDLDFAWLIEYIIDFWLSLRQTKDDETILMEQIKLTLLLDNINKTKKNGIHWNEDWDKQRTEYIKQKIERIEQTLQNIKWWFDPEYIISQWHRDVRWEWTYCSKVACINIQNIEKQFGNKEPEELMRHQIDTTQLQPNQIPVYRWGILKETGWKALLPQLIKRKLVDEVPLNPERQDITQTIKEYMKTKAIQTQWNVFDIYLYTPNGHRCIFFIWSDGKYYALDPYRWWSKKAVPLESYIKKVYPKLTNKTLLINKITYARLDQTTRQSLQDIALNMKGNPEIHYAIRKKFGDDMAKNLEQYYHPHILENHIETIEKQDQILITLEDVKGKIRIYNNIHPQVVVNTINEIPYPIIRKNIIMYILQNNVKWLQKYIGMWKDNNPNERPDGKFGNTTLQFLQRMSEESYLQEQDVYNEELTAKQ